MYNIALVNDQSDQLEVISGKLEIGLSDDYRWKILPIKPLDDIRKYPSWILENEVSTIILDERLYESPRDGGKPVEYTGHEVAIFIRESNKEIPIISLTNYASDEELRESLDNFHLIISRNDFSNNFDNYLNLIKKLSEKYFKENQDRLVRIAEISEIIAKGNHDEDLITELKQLREILQLPHYSSSIEDRSQFLKLMEDEIKIIDDLKNEIESLLKSDSKE